MSAVECTAVTPTRAAGGNAATATLTDVDIRSQLSARPRRAPDFERENKAYALLTEDLAGNPGNLLQRLVEIAADLCDAHTAGISLLEGDVFRWVAVAGVFAGARGGTMPRAASPCGVCIDGNSPQLMHLPDRCFPELLAEPRFVEALLVPFHDDVQPVGTVWIVSHDDQRHFDQEDERVVIALSRFASAICRALVRVAQTTTVSQPVAHRTHRIETLEPIWGTGSEMNEVMNLVERVANSDVSVLLSGESGVGKEVIARELHRRSDRRARPFVKVNCAALPSDLLESELFGHERGAFTGAQGARAGKFEFADHGTILLDEIGEMPVALQAKLLHVLQDMAFTRLGSNRTTAVDVRVIAATNRDLPAMMRAGVFREDLYFRLQVIEIRVPPLRHRPDDIVALVNCFLRRYAKQYGQPLLSLSARLRQVLTDYSWPGNVRELENTIKRFVILRDENLILAELRRKTSTVAPASPVESQTPPCNGEIPAPLRAAALATEREVIQKALERSRWNRRRVAEELGVSYKTLRTKMRVCGLTSSAG
jgi:transcriptional regulator with GAF, ATPase, and Fis domain